MAQQADIYRYFNYIVQKISNAKAAADGLADNMFHRGIEGEIRELAAKECIEPFLTHSFKCGNGKVIDMFGNISDQIDLLIYQTKTAPPILISKELGIYPTECVRYAFEIKSRITSTEIKDALKKFKSINQLTRFPKQKKDGTIVGEEGPTTVLFAFDSDISGNELERLMKNNDNAHCTVLCVLGKGYWFRSAKGWESFQRFNDKPIGHEFVGFITGIMNSLSMEESTLRGFKPGGYVTGPDDYDFEQYV